MFNYIGILNKSSAVNTAITCNFLNNLNNLNLVLAKGNIIEIYNITNEGLESTPYLNVYGKIILLEKIPADSNSLNLHNKNIISSSTYGDSLFILTEDLDFSIIAYNKTKNEIVNLDKGTVKEDIGKRQDKIHSVFEANYEYAVISAYKNLFKIVFLKNRSKNEDFSVRYDYEDLLNLFPLNGCAELINKNGQSASANIQTVYKNVNNMNNTTTSSSNTNTINKQFLSKNLQNFGMIKVVNNYGSEIKSVKLETFNLNIHKGEVNKDIVNGLDLTYNPTCSMVLSPKVGGLVIFFSNYLKYYSIANNRLIEKETKTFCDRKFISFCEIDNCRYICADNFGNLFLLAFKKNEVNNITPDEGFSIVFQLLGEVNYPSSLTYLDNNYVFIGSEKANSQLIKITKTLTSNPSRPFIQIVEEYENLAPISEFTILNSQGEEGNTEILCVSGDEKSCSLKTLRKGTSINTEAIIPINVCNLFSVNYNNSESMIIDEMTDNILLFANNINHTSLINFNYNNNSISNFFSEFIDLKERTLFACNIKHDNKNFILQVTENFLFLYDNFLKLVNKTSTIIKPLQIRYKKNKGCLYIYNKNNILLRYKMSDLINSKNISPELICDDVLISYFNISDDLLIYSQWNSNKIFIYSFKTKKTEILCEFDVTASCTGIQVIKNEGIKFLFIAFSNGKMYYFKLKSNLFFHF
jgi:hypothetical protein